MCDRKPPLSSTTRQLYLTRLRSLFLDLADNGHPLSPDLIRREDIPRIAHYLPKPLSLEDDQRLESQLRRINDLESNALLLIRFTGLRIGECVDLPVDCLQQLSPEQWSLHVPLGKLRKERCVPIDEDTRLILDRILAFRALFRPSCTEKLQASCSLADAAAINSGTSFSAKHYTKLRASLAAPPKSLRIAFVTPTQRPCCASASVCPLSCNYWDTPIFI
jgi:integrase